MRDHVVEHRLGGQHQAPRERQAPGRAQLPQRERGSRIATPATSRAEGRGALPDAGARSRRASARYQASTRASARPAAHLQPPSRRSAGRLRGRPGTASASGVVEPGERVAVGERAAPARAAPPLGHPGRGRPRGTPRRARRARAGTVTRTPAGAHPQRHAPRAAVAHHLAREWVIRGAPSSNGTLTRRLSGGRSGGLRPSSLGRVLLASRGGAGDPGLRSRAAASSSGRGGPMRRAFARKGRASAAIPPETRNEAG